jgi:hypothetical protein
VNSQSFTFELTGSPGWVYRVESRTAIDQGDWATFATFPAGAAVTPVQFSIPLDGPQRFYRVVVE